MRAMNQALSVSLRQLPDWGGMIALPIVRDGIVAETVALYF